MITLPTTYSTNIAEVEQFLIRIILNTAEYVFIQVSKGVAWKDNAIDDNSIGSLGYILEDVSAHKIQGVEQSIFSETSEEIDIEGGGNFQNMGSIKITLHNLTDLAAYLQRWNLINNEVEIFAGHADSGTLYFEDDCISVFRGYVDDAVQHDYTTLALNLIDYASQLDVMFPTRFINIVDFPFADSDLINKPYQILIGDWTSNYEDNWKHGDLLTSPCYFTSNITKEILASNNASPVDPYLLCSMNSGYIGKIVNSNIDSASGMLKYNFRSELVRGEFIIKPNSYYLDPSGDPILINPINAFIGNGTDIVDLTSGATSKGIKFISDDTDNIGDWLEWTSGIYIKLVIQFGDFSFSGGTVGGFVEGWGTGISYYDKQVIVGDYANTTQTFNIANVPANCLGWNQLANNKFLIYSEPDESIEIKFLYLYIYSTINAFERIAPKIIVAPRYSLRDNRGGR